MKYHIYVPSKGRYEENHTVSLFKKYNIPFTLVVEPQESKQYLKAFDSSDILVIDSNDKGIAYVRNWIKDYSVFQGELYHWAIDDDMRVFRRRVGTKNVEVSPEEVLLEVEKEVDRYCNIGQAGISYFAFAFASKDDICLNRQIYSVMLNNNSTPYRFRDGVIDDIDYSLQNLYGGWCTLFFTRIMFESVPTNKQKGGNTEFYENGAREARTIGLAKAWPEIKEPKMTKTGFRAYTGHLWRKFPQRPVLKEAHES